VAAVVGAGRELGVNERDENPAAGASVPPSDELLRLIVESSTDFAIMTLDPQGIVTSWNIGAERLLGWADDEIVGRSGHIIFTPEDRAAGIPVLEQAKALADGRAEDERWHMRNDGSRFWGSGLLMPLSGAPGFLKIMRDRTEKRRAEAEVLEGREQLEAMFAQPVVGIVQTEPSGRITLVNDRFCEIVGRAREILLALRFQDLADQDELPATQSALDQLIQTGKPFMLDARHVRPEGREIWVSHAVSLARDAGGSPWRVIVLSRDITERKLAEQRLAESEDRFRSLATNIPQLVFRSRATGERTWGSPQWEVYAGLSDARSRDFGWLEAIHPDDRATTVEAWQRAPQTGSYDVEHRIRRHADGANRWHQTRAAPTPSADEWVGTSTDIHDLRDLQDRQRVLLAELQHRTRNLLAVIQAVARQTIRSSGSMADFAREFESRLRALSRLQGLLATVTHDKLGLGDLVRTEIRALGVPEGKVQMNGPAIELPAASAQTLALSLHELATNAVKYGALAQPSGRLSIEWRLAEGGHWVVLDWREAGVTLPAADVPRRRGYGTELIERALPYELGAKARLQFAPDGVRCTIEVPLEGQTAVSEAS
jgi:PAS domain S-box-containing protein